MQLKHFCKIVFLLLFCLKSGIGFSQAYTTAKTAGKKTQKLYQKALDQEREGDYDAVLATVNKALELEPKFIDGHLKKAAVLYDKKQYDSAERSFERALELDPAYKPRIWYQLAVTEMRQDKFEEAGKHFEKYLVSGPQSKNLIKRAKRHLTNCAFAAEAIKNPVPFAPKSIGDNINTTNSEYLPSISADGAFLVYTRRINNQEDLYYSNFKDGTWQKGQPMEAINTPFNEATQTLSADGRMLVYTACNRKEGLGGCDLYYSAVQGNRWTPPVNMGPVVNTRAWDSQPSLSANGKTLFFASERGGGKGKRDLWVAQKRESGRWAKPQNLGAIINTDGNDEAPFIHPDGQTLYFMSEGHPGMGDYDLYYSRKEADGTWGRPQNLGYPINTKAHEGALFVSLDGTTAYFTSDKSFEDSEEAPLRKRDFDIYYFELPPAARPLPVTYVKAVVKDQNTKQRLIADTEIIDVETGKIIEALSTSENGTFLITLPIGKNYALNVSKENYLFHSENFELTSSSQISDPFLLDIELVPIPEVVKNEHTATPVILKNVFFETGSAALKASSTAELDRLKTLLEENPALNIQINGHTDNVGSGEDNLTLSEARAVAVQQYLIDQGIAKDRLAAKGFGETQPIDTNETEMGRRNNRRTEFVITE